LLIIAADADMSSLMPGAPNHAEHHFAVPPYCWRRYATPLMFACLTALPKAAAKSAFADCDPHRPHYCLFSIAIFSSPTARQVFAMPFDAQFFARYAARFARCEF